MIAALISASARHRGGVLLAALIAAAIGFYHLVTLPIDAIPDVTGVQVQVNTAVPGLAAEEIETRVTVPLERMMGGQPGLVGFRSLTRSGLSQVTLLYEDGTDVMRARQVVTERLATASAMLPPGAAPQLAPITTGLGEILYYTLEWDHPPHAEAHHPGLTPASQQDEHLMALAETQEYVVVPMLRQVQGVAEVNSIGGLERQYVIEPDLQKLRAAGVTPAELAAAVGANADNAGGGLITQGPRRLVVRTDAKVMHPEDIAALPVKFAGGVRPLTVGDLASVRVGHTLRSGAATVDGKQTVLGTIMMLSGQNSREVARRIDAHLDEVQAVLPRGMVIKVRYDRADIVERTVATVRSNLSEGALLVAVVLILALGQWRAALIVAAVIPVAFLLASIGMVRLDISGNLMSLGALDFGLVVDGAIVAVENALRRLSAETERQGRALADDQRRAIIASAMGQVARPVAFGVAIITLVYVPVLALGGVEGKLFRPMAITVMLALTAALLVSVTLVPALASYWLKAGESHGPTKLVATLEGVYRPVLAATLQRPLLAIVPAVLAVVAAGLVFTRLGTVFTPRLDEGSITTMVYRPVDMSLEEALAEEMAVEQALLKKFPQLTHVFSRIGTAAVATDPMPPNENDLYIAYKPKAEWPADGPQDKAELVRAIEKTAQAVHAGQRFLFAQPIEMRFNEMLEGTRADLSVKIYGDDNDRLEQLGAAVLKVLRRLPGTAQAEYEVDGRTPSLVVKVNRDALVRLGLGAAEVNRAISTALAGQEVGAILEGIRRHGIVVRLPDAQRADLDTIRALPLRVGQSGLVSLGQVASLEEVMAVEPVRRDNGQKRAALLVNLSGSDVEGYVARAKAELAKAVPLPEGYRIEYGGQFKQLQEAKARLAVLVPACLLLILGLVYGALRSLPQALIVFAGIPLAVTGGVFALGLRGMPFSITAAIGFIALSGIAMLNGLVMVDHVNHLREHGMAKDEAVRAGALDRLRPVISTALVASIGFLPMAIATGAGAEVQRPLATVVIGGIISSTLLTLLLLPALYRRFVRA
ncbi:efflux RND transporter permease subunit [Sandarakinorhabdus oryzae]|uniref:efflux RND transporter permease subunit n=1 Tax=Sandarakinorhabdus oryzae TaxID=2675220 RepID=UPI0012E2D5C8|nr:CusA/CzcA family heavy metal efflux RND transporter [Sandarakinorhabdus oryzae]